MAFAFEQMERGSGVLYGACHGIWIMMIFAKPTAMEMRLAKPALKVMIEKYPTGFPTLSWVLPSAGVMMDTEARHMAGEVTREFNSNILAMATIIEGTGFQAAAVRAIVGGIDMIVRAETPRKTFAGAGLAVAWCNHYVTDGPRSIKDTDGVAQSLTALRWSLEKKP